MSSNLLNQFLEDYFRPRRSFSWGADDCSFGMVSEWVKLRTGIDPAAGRENLYLRARGAKQFIDANGGMVMIITAIARELDLPITDDPMTGDVGVVESDRIVFGQALAIRSRNLWCVRAPRGFAALELRTIMAWRVP